MSDDEGFDPLAWAEAETAHMTPAQVADVQALLVGIFSTYVDRSHLPPLTAARWREFVRLAVRDVSTPPTAPLTPEQPPADHGDGSGAGGREGGEGA